MTTLEIPKFPSTEELLAKYLLAEDAIEHRTQQRAQIRQMVNGDSDDFLAVLGSDSMTDDLGTLILESIHTHDLNKKPGLIAVQRVVPYKSRSQPLIAWPGFEFDRPEVAFSYMHSIVNSRGGVAMEIGLDHHVPRYGHLQAVPWFGSRLDPNKTLEYAQALFHYQPDITMGVKCNVDGEVKPGIDIVNEINHLYEKAGFTGKAAFFIYRGGNNARTPQKWEDGYLEAHEATEGRLGVDTNHATAQAHDPEFKKTPEGSLEAMDHIESLKERGYGPMATWSEVSDIVSPVDENVPFRAGVKRILAIAGVAA